MGVRRRGLEAETILLDFLEDEDFEAAAWKLLLWVNVLKPTSFVVPG